MKPANIVTPTPGTLRRYGMTTQDWEDLGELQGWRCPCGRVPGTGKFNIDHEHVRGWKQMKPEDRKAYVRGLVCWNCNKYQLARGATSDRLYRLSEYLLDYDRMKEMRDAV